MEGLSGLGQRSQRLLLGRRRGAGRLQGIQQQRGHRWDTPPRTTAQRYGAGLLAGDGLGRAASVAPCA